jgi:pimeloyl-[acyl-carrier protein] methyl ester esterase
MVLPRNTEAETGDSRPGNRDPRSQCHIRDIVLLHGWGSEASIWNGLQAKLAPRFRVSTPDLPGYGSTPMCASCTAEGMADALARTAPPRCHVVGWSLGGLVALAWAGRAPRQVERLALIATTPSFLQQPGWTDAMDARTFAGFEEAAASDPAAALRRFVLLQSQGDDRAKLVARQLRSALAPAAAALGAGLRVLRRTDLRARLESLRSPALVIHGDRDRLVPHAAGERMSRLLPGARFLAVRGAAHAPFLSNPEAVVAALQEHLDA